MFLVHIRRLFGSEAEMEMVYEFLDDIFSEFGKYTLITGWYGPDEDRESGEQDDWRMVC